MALQNVCSFGTEGREEDGSTLVPPQKTIHPYLVFRGCDIKDLHVHETLEEEPVEIKKEPELPEKDLRLPPVVSTPPDVLPEALPAQPITTTTTKIAQRVKKSQRPRTSNTMSHIGTGASLLHRKERGAVTTGLPSPTPQDDFDFQSNLQHFGRDDNDDDGGDDEEDMAAYAKKDFFDSISCDATDKQNGVHNRLRGNTERMLNTETFGAIALNSQRRRRNHRTGGQEGRSGGRGRGRGRGGQGKARETSWRKNNSSQQETTANS